MKYIIFILMLITGGICHAGEDNNKHNGKLTSKECQRILDKQIANYDGRYDENLDEEVKKAEGKKEVKK